MVCNPLARNCGRGLLAAAGFALASVLAGCETDPATAEPSPPPPSPSSTVAFPTLIPTGTATAGPTATPFVDWRAEVGSLLLADSFDEEDAWILTQSDTGASSIDSGRLSVSVRQARAYQFVTRQGDSFSDVFVEVDVYTELCAPGDEFGLMFRVNGLGEHYRFVIGCDATARASRALETGSRALTWWIPSPAILPASPVRNHLALLARGDTFRFFVNDVEVLSARDVSLASGRIGLLARAGTTGQVSVSFDDLSLRSLKGLGTPTPTTPPTPLP